MSSSGVVDDDRCEIHNCGLRLMNILGVETKYCPRCLDEEKSTEISSRETPQAEDVTIKISTTFMVKTDRGTYEYHALEVECKDCPHESALDNAVSKLQAAMMEKYGVQL